MADNKISNKAKKTSTISDVALVRKRLSELRPVLANAVVGDFSKNLKVPEAEDEFTELFVGVQTMQEVIREQLKELQELNQKLEIKASERRRALEEAQALTHLGSWEWDIATGHITWTDELYRIYGLKPQEREIGFAEFINMVHSDDREHVQKTINDSYTSGKPFEFEHRIILPNGRHRDLFGMGKVIKNKSGKPERMIGTSQDITDRKAAERALKQSDERFQAVTAATHDLVYDLDLGSEAMWYNEVLQNDYGYTRQSIEPTLSWWLDRIHPAEVEHVRAQFRKLLKSKQRNWSIEYQFRKADGSYAVVRNRAYVLHDHAGKPERIIGSCQDVTHQKQLDRAKDEFISLVSHQLRTPLTIIRLYGNMLIDGIAGPLDKQQQSYIKKMTFASIRLIKLVSDILNISRIELNRITIDRTPIDANALIGSCVEELTPVAKAKAAAITFDPQPGLEKAPLDATLFNEIVHNLVGNALRYGSDHNGKVTVSFTKSKQGYLLEVADNGVGIPRADQLHIFERFYRAHNAASVDSEGSGLGLYMVKLFTEAAGGKVWFKSTEGKGTTFYVLFPPSGMRAVRVKQ